MKLDSRELVRLALWPVIGRLERLRRDAGRAQDELARRLARRFARTKIGQDLRLERVTDAKTLSACATLREYEAHQPFFERPAYWGVTSGTTTFEKTLPLTHDLLRENGRGYSLLMASLLLERGSLSPILGKTLYLGSSTPLTRGADGVERGMITSITVKRMPVLFRQQLVPGTRLDDLPDWSFKMKALGEMVLEEDIRIISGMPPWLLAFARHLEDQFGIGNLHEIWPRLEFVVHGGTFADPYRRRLEQHFGPAGFRDVFTATEGLFGIQDRSEPGLLPLADSAFYELVPVEELESAKPRRFLLTEVELDVEYAIVCSTFGGLFGYLLGDTVRFVSREPFRFLVSGRLGRRANIAGEKITLAQIEGVIAAVSERLGVRFTEAAPVTVPPTKSAGPHHRWFVETDDDTTLDEAAIAAALDEEMGALNSTYRVWRQGSPPPIASPRVRALPPGSFERWLSRIGRAFGQHKFPRILESIPPEFEDA